MNGRQLSPTRKTVFGGLALLLGAAGMWAVPSAAFATDGVRTEHLVTDETTLVQAIAAINESPDPDGDLISFVASTPTTIALTSSLPAFDAAAPQHIEIAGATDPEGRLLVTLDGQSHASRVLGFVNPNGGSMQVSGLRIVGARASAISVSGPGTTDLSVSVVDISGAQNAGISYAPLSGSVDIRDAILSQNETGLAIDVEAAAGEPRRVVHVFNVTASENQIAGVRVDASAETEESLDMRIVSVAASENLGHGFSVETYRYATPLFQSVAANRNAGDGFAIESGSGSTVTIDRSSIRENSNSGISDRTGGAANLAIEKSDIAANEGKAIDFTGTNGGVFSLRDSAVREHLDPNEIGSVATVAFANTTGEAQVENTSFLRNDGVGEALVMYCEEGGTISLANSTFAQNAATEPGAAALRVSNCGTVTLTNITVAENQGVGTSLDYNDRTVVANSVFAGSSDFDVLRSGTGPFTVTHSLVENPDAATGAAMHTGAGNLATGVDPQLAPLAYLGGPELGEDALAFQTMLPEQGSPVIDAGLDSLVPASLVSDQRGASRISGSAVDMGAVETQAEPPAEPGLDLVASRTPDVVSKAGEEILFEFDMKNIGNVPLADVTLQLSGFTGVGALGDMSCTPAENPVLPADPDIVIHCTVPYSVVVADLTGEAIEITGIASGVTPSDSLVWSPERALAVDTVKASLPPSDVTPNGTDGKGLPNTGTPVPVWLAVLGVALLLAGVIALVGKQRSQA